jgi:hypothetical protein
VHFRFDELAPGLTGNCYVLPPSWFDKLTMRVRKKGFILSQSKDETRVTQ